MSSRGDRGDISLKNETNLALAGAAPACEPAAREFSSRRTIRRRPLCCLLHLLVLNAVGEGEGEGEVETSVRYS